MTASYFCTTVKEFDKMSREIRQYICTETERICNMGSDRFYEYPLFIFTGQHVFRIYFSDGELLLEIWPREEFDENVQDGIFQDPEDPAGSDYISPKAYIPAGSVCGMAAVRGCGTARDLKGMDILLTDGSRICVRGSDLVYGTMDTWVECASRPS